MAPFVDLIVSVIATGFVLAAVWSVVWLVRTYHRPVTATRVRPERAEPIDFNEALRTIGGPPKWESVKRSDR